MKKSHFNRLFLFYAVILFIALLISEIFISTTVKENHLDELRRNLSIQVDLISDRINFSRNRIDGVCNELKKKTGARFTVVLADGRVIGDSDTASADMENHLQRTEIAQAALFRTGSTIRRSETVKTDFLYFAKKISFGRDQSGFIRLAVPLTDIDHAVNQTRINILVIFGLVFLGIWLFILWQTNQLRRLVIQIKEFSFSLASGEIDRRLFMKSGGEFGEIAGNLVEMSETLRGLLKQSEEERSRLNAILKNMPDALLIINPKGTVLLANAAASALFGEQPLYGKHYMEIIRSSAFSELIDNINANPALSKAEIKLETPDEHHFNVLVSPLFYNERDLSGFVVVLHDITRLEKLEQVRKDFVANISHEIKTPITAIKGFADTLLDGAIDDRENAARFIDTIRQNSERINNLVDDLLMLSKIELGVIAINKTQIDIRDTLDQVISLLADKAHITNLSIETVLHPEVTTIAADKDRLIQIFTNLVDNAIKFTESGKVAFGTGLENGRPLLFVEDTGIGVPIKHISRLGERFYRVDTARSRKMGGTGLGLAIVKHLVKAHGWEMHIESKQGKGTFIRIYL